MKQTFIFAILIFCFFTTGQLSAQTADNRILVAGNPALTGETIDKSGDFFQWVLGGNFTSDKYAATDSPKLWNWPIHPENFQAPKLMELARLQAWTLKPAMRKK